MHMVTDPLVFNNVSWFYLWIFNLFLMDFFYPFDLTSFSWCVITSYVMQACGSFKKCFFDGDCSLMQVCEEVVLGDAWKLNWFMRNILDDWWWLMTFFPFGDEMSFREMVLIYAMVHIWLLLLMLIHDIGCCEGLLCHLLDLDMMLILGRLILHWHFSQGSFNMFRSFILSSWEPSNLLFFSWVSSWILVEK